MEPVAFVRTHYPQKFGVPRQSGLVPDARARLIFEPPFRDPDMVRGLDGFSHLWLIWEFSANKKAGWHSTVRPPRLGGNKRMGVFATRAPFRPNPIGLSVVKLERIEYHPEYGPILHLLGADLLDKTPILDIKPYIPHVDSVPEATEGFTSQAYPKLDVEIPDNLKEKMPSHLLQALIDTLALDPRPSYQDDEARLYGLLFEKWYIKFSVKDHTLIVSDIIEV